MASPRFITSAIWPDNHKEILREMHSAGATALEIAIKLGRTRNSIIGFIHRSGLANTRPKKPAIRVPKAPQQLKPKENKTLFVKPIVEIEKPKSTDGVLLIFTNNRQCKFISDDPCGKDTKCCGKKSLLGKSWCFEHYQLIYNKEPLLNMRGQLHG